MDVKPARKAAAGAAMVPVADASGRLASAHAPTSRGGARLTVTVSGGDAKSQDAPLPVISRKHTPGVGHGDSETVARDRHKPGQSTAAVATGRSADAPARAPKPAADLPSAVDFAGSVHGGAVALPARIPAQVGFRIASHKVDERRRVGAAVSWYDYAIRGDCAEVVGAQKWD